MPTTTTGVATEFISFSRASNATVTDSNGRIDWAAHNLLLASEQFDNAVWEKTNITVTANYAAAPNGTTTADRAVYVGSLGTPATRQLRQAIAISTSELRTTFGIWVSGTGKFRVQNVHGGVLANYSSDITATATPTLYTLTVTNAANAGNGFQVAGICAATTDDAFDLNVWGAHLYRSDLGGMQANTSAYPMYNPTTPKNLLGFTETFSDSYWTKSNAPITANVDVAPNGLQTADRLTFSAQYGQLAKTGVVTVSGSVCTVSVWLKLESGNANLALRASSSGTIYLQNITVTSSWQRFSATFTHDGTNNIGFVIEDRNASGWGSVLIWGAQLSDSASLDPYTPNHFAAPSAAAYYGPRLDYDPVTLAAKGLLVEEQRTNLLLRSAEFDNASWSKSAATVTANVGVSPDGTSTAEKIVESATTAQHYILQSSTTTATAHTFSVYAKAGERSFILLQCDNPVVTQYFNVSAGSLGTATGSPISSITSVGNGWYRCVMTFTAVAATPAFYVILASANGTSSYAGDGTSGAFVYGAQLEAGSFATSYIPTTTASATRSADVAQVGTAAFPYSATEGTLVFSGSYVGFSSGKEPTFVNLGDDTPNTNWAVIYQGSSTIIGARRSNSTNATNITVSDSQSANVIRKAGLAFAVGGTDALSLNGGTVATQSGVVAPYAATTLMLGRFATAPGYLNGHIRQITYIPRRLSNAELQSRSA